MKLARFGFLFATVCFAFAGSLVAYGMFGCYLLAAVESVRRGDI